MSLNVGRPTSIRGLPEGRFWFLFSREGWPQLVSGWTFEKTTLKWEFDMPGSGQFRPTIPLRKSIRRTLVLVAEAPLDKRAFGRGALVSPDGSARELVFSSRSGGDPRELRCKAELTGGRHHLLVRVSSGASGYFAEVSFDVTESGSDDAQRIDLSDASSVEVMAVDADGRAVPRAVVTLVPKDPRWRGVGEVLTFATNSAGLLRERGFKPGTTYRIQGTDVDVTAGGTRVTIVMP